MEGFVHPDFGGVALAFERQLARTDGGAAVTVYHRGERVVDVWGGRRTTDGEPWERDTLAMCASTTKGVASTALHVLADRGLVDYDAPVATYWPEFAQNGKASMTVRHVLSHSAGMHRLDTLIDDGMRILDWEYMVEALARAAPAYPPGTKVGYHAITFGWLVGEIVRRVSGQPIDVFVKEELAKPLGLDGLHIGCRPDARHRIAPLEPMRRSSRLTAPLQPISSLAVGGLSLWLSATGSHVNLRRMRTTFAPRAMEEVMLAPELLDAVIPAVNGFLTAESLAAMYAMLAGGGVLGDVRILSPATVNALSTVQNRAVDRILVMPMHWRLGYHRILRTRGLLPHAFGHFGFGGSGGWAHRPSELALGMVCNRGSGTPVGDVRLVRLTTATIEAARRRETTSTRPA